MLLSQMLKQFSRFSKINIIKTILQLKKFKELIQIREVINCTFTCRLTETEEGEIMTK